MGIKCSESRLNFKTQKKVLRKHWGQIKISIVHSLSESFWARDGLCFFGETYLYVNQWKLVYNNRLSEEYIKQIKNKYQRLQTDTISNAQNTFPDFFWVLISFS